MTVFKSRTFRSFLTVFAVMIVSACANTMANTPQHNMKEGMSMSSCPCCGKMAEQSQSGDKKPCCCSGMMDGKKGCCGGGDGKPMICQPKN